jgi:hypothetical protein
LNREDRFAHTERRELARHALLELARGSLSGRGEFARQREGGRFALRDFLPGCGRLTGVRRQRRQIALHRRAYLGQLVGRDAVFATQAAEQLEASVDGVEPVWVGLQSLGGCAQLQRGFLELHAAALDQLGRAGQSGRHGAQLAELRRQPSQRADGRRLSGLEHRLTVAADLLQAFGVPQQLALGAQLRVLSAARGGVGELGRLKLEQLAAFAQGSGLVLQRL